MTLLICAAAVAWISAVGFFLALAATAAQADRHHP
jgi:hypothetical protein